MSCRPVEAPGPLAAAAAAPGGKISERQNEEVGNRAPVCLQGAPCRKRRARMEEETRVPLQWLMRAQSRPPHMTVQGAWRCPEPPAPRRRGSPLPCDPRR